MPDVMPSEFTQLTDADLAAIERECQEARKMLAYPHGVAIKGIRADNLLATSVPRLVREVRELRRLAVVEGA